MENKELEKQKVFEAKNTGKAYEEQYIKIVESKYPKLSKTQKEAMTYILIADSLTIEQMSDDNKFNPYYMFSFKAQKVENDIILTRQSSATLKALEKKGLIKIIEDGRKGVDSIRLIK